ncbi:hypothetical protein ATY75_31040 [Rhizobium sp. N122]|nr:hypothetical protein ATY75_31040 [Rhizobium sp. N122]
MNHKIKGKGISARFRLALTDSKCNWALLYIERWLTAPMEKNGEVIERMRGTPQGGVVSPILSNLFLHYAFDVWMTRTHPDLP